MVYGNTRSKNEQILINDVLKKDIGLEEQTLLIEAFHWKKCIHPDDAEIVYEALGSLTNQTRTSFDIEHRFLFSNGRYEWVRNYAIVLEYDLQNNPSKILGVQQNIHNYKQTIHTLETAKKTT
jgi:hypothetical protein